LAFGLSLQNPQTKNSPHPPQNPVKCQTKVVSETLLQPAILEKKNLEPKKKESRSSNDIKTHLKKPYRMGCVDSGDDFYGADPVSPAECADGT
jgi:hypothetical protein